MKAVIFDMDGVIINSEQFWAQAEREVFSSLGVQLSDKLCQHTQRMTTAEVTEFWFRKYPWKDTDLKQVENMVIDRVIELIELEDCEISGIKELVSELKKQGFKIGLATNSPEKIIPVVLRKIRIEHLFDTICSAELEEKGKPHPNVYLSAAKNLGIIPEHCIAIEDSNSGIKAAKAAGMTVGGFINSSTNHSLREANFIIRNFEEMNPALLKKVKPNRSI